MALVAHKSNCCNYHPQSNEGHSDSTSIEDLPTEVLLNVFNSLNRNDRNSARLVCSTWYYTFCNFYTERVVVPDVYSSFGEQILQLLSNSQRRITHLEFHCSLFTNCVPTFWTNAGPQIRFLQLDDCDFPMQMLPLVLKSCVNLRVLKLKFFRDKFFWPYPETTSILQQLVTALEDLTMLGTTVATVHSLEIKVLQENPVISELLMRLLRIFPNVKRLSLVSVTASHRFRKLLPVLLRTSAARLEALEVYSQFDGCPQWDIIMVIPNLTRLTEISMKVRNSLIPRAVIPFLKKQQCVRQLKCKIYGDLASEGEDEEDDHSDELIEFALTHCSELESLRLLTDDQIVWRKGWLEKIVTSKLHTLKLKCGLIRMPVAVRAVAPINRCLRKLQVSEGWVAEEPVEEYDRKFLILLETFRNLESFQIYVLTHTLVAAVNKLQKNLRIFRTEMRTMHPSINETSFPFDGVDLDNLQKLQHLSIHLGPEFPKSILDRPLLNLRYLVLQSSERISLLMSSLLHVPNLETLIVITKAVVDPQLLTETIHTLTKLKYMWFCHNENYKWTANDVNLIFDLCPSLEIVICGADIFHFEAKGKKALHECRGEHMRTFLRDRTVRFNFNHLRQFT